MIMGFIWVSIGTKSQIIRVNSFKNGEGTVRLKKGAPGPVYYLLGSEVISCCLLGVRLLPLWGIYTTCLHPG